MNNEMKIRKRYQSPYLRIIQLEAEKIFAVSDSSIGTGGGSPEPPMSKTTFRYVIHKVEDGKNAW